MIKQVGNNPHCYTQRARMVAYNLCGKFHYRGKWVTEKNHLGVKLRVFEAIDWGEHCKAVRNYYPYDANLGLNEPFIDLMLYKPFRFHQFMLVHEGDCCFLVSPYYLEGGGTAIDCVPKSWVRTNHITRADAQILCPRETPVTTNIEDTSNG